jgi:ribosomal protein S18 acetylase RimI-like enzyme
MLSSPSVVVTSDFDDSTDSTGGGLERIVQDILIRPARHDDLPAVRQVAGVVWRATYAGSIPDVDIEQFLASEYSERSMTAAVSRLGDGFVVAEAGAAIVGYTMAGVNREGEPELYAIYVLPEHHGRSVGHMLWNAAKDALDRHGHRRMCCWVLASNDRARRFYERQGAFFSEEREFPVGATMIREARYCLDFGH